MPSRAIPTELADRERQASVLLGLRERRKAESDDPRDWDLTRAAARIGVSASSLSRYEAGDVILPISYLRPIAAAYGVSRRDLADALGLLDDPAEEAPAPWSMSDALLHGGIPRDDIPDFVRSYGNEPIETQQAVTKHIIRSYREAVKKVQDEMLARCNRPA